MKKFVAILVLIFGFSLLIFGQSGRKITVQPTPMPTVVQNQEEGYSESKPSNRRILSPNTSLRNVPQTSKTTQTQTTNSDGEVLDDSEDSVIKVETNLITIPVSVFDKNGLYIPDLSKSNFKIFEDGKEQQIEYFSTTETPFTVVLLLDTSPSTEFKIDEIQDAAIAFVNQLQPQDSVMVIEFDQNVHVLTEATTDRQKIFKGIKRADFGGGTSLYDAVDFTLRKRLSKIQGRKAIVLFTDGVDTTSTKRGYDGSLHEAEEADTIIFPIYYNTFLDGQRRQIGSPFPTIIRGNTRQEYALGRAYLKDLADYTGGRVFNAENTPGGLTRTFESIAEELRRQYSIGYVPTDPGKTGQRKMIKVRVNRPNLVIRSRDSYIVGATDTQQTTQTK